MIGGRFPKRPPILSEQKTEKLTGGLFRQASFIAAMILTHSPQGWFLTLVSWLLALSLGVTAALTALRQASSILFMTAAGRESQFGRWWQRQQFWHRMSLPSLTFFSQPPPFDLRVFRRSCTERDGYLSWQPVEYRHPGPIRTFWNPDRRRQKVVLEAASQLLREVQVAISSGESSFLSGPAYHLLLAAGRRTEPGAATQFLLCQIFVTQERAPEILFVSRLETPEPS